jgi:hypothetical protein
MQFTVRNKFLTNRPEGEQLREDLEQQLQQVHAGEVVEISFAKVDAMIGSATDEFLGKLLTARGAGDLPDVAFVISGLNDNTRFEIELCLARRNAAVAARTDQGVELLGGDNYLKDTFARAASRVEFRASDLADELRVTPQNMNNRLKRLVDDGALLRERDRDANGKQFIYRVPVAAVSS